METNNELIDHLVDSRLKSIQRRHTYSIVSNLVLIIVFILIGIYVYNNIEEFKSLSSDACRLCELKTNGTCMSQSYNTIVQQIKEQTNNSYAPTFNINFSEFVK